MIELFGIRKSSIIRTFKKFDHSNFLKNKKTFGYPGLSIQVPVMTALCTYNDQQHTPRVGRPKTVNEMMIFTSSSNIDVSKLSKKFDQSNFLNISKSSINRTFWNSKKFDQSNFFYFHKVRMIELSDRTYDRTFSNLKSSIP